jgi:hypothetical protein
MKLTTLLFIGFLMTSIAYSQTGKNDSIVNYIKTESVGGKLDFKIALEKEGKSKTLTIYKGIAYNPKDYSILLWGHAVKKLGIKKIIEATTLWESINKREMTKPEKTALENGFKAKIK